MFETNLFTLLIVLLFAGALAYKSTYLHTKTIGYFSLLQIIYLIIIPGVACTFGFSYLQTIMDRPLNATTILPDGFLINTSLLAIVFTYGGVAIHAVTKMLSELEDIRYKQTLAHEINKYFHLTFSHNLIFGGGLLIVTCFTLLELNHIPPQNQQSISLAIVKGLILGVSIIIGMRRYTIPIYQDGYTGKWSDLKAVFLIIWLSGILLLYGIFKTDPSFKNYQLLLPVLLSYVTVALLNLLLVFRRIKRGGFRIYFRWGKIKQKVWES